MTVLAASAPSLWGEAPGRRPARQRWFLVITLLILPLAAWIGGGLRLAQAPAAPESDALRLRIVQPAIPQKLKWQRDKRYLNAIRNLDT